MLDTVLGNGDTKKHCVVKALSGIKHSIVEICIDCFGIIVGETILSRISEKMRWIHIFLK